MSADNFVLENALYRGTSSNPIMFDLMLRLHKLEMNAGWKLHVIHVTRKRMIQQGTGGLSQGDLMSGVTGGMDMLSFVLLKNAPMNILVL
jgi:hypothetical protein